MNYIRLPVMSRTQEWIDALGAPLLDRPRLPIPATIGNVVSESGLGLLANDFGKIAPERFRKSVSNFGAEADRISAYDFTWGLNSAHSCISAAIRGARSSNIMLNYGWLTPNNYDLKRRALLAYQRIASRHAAFVLFMTREQELQAQTHLPSSVPVGRIRIGVDTAFYSYPADQSELFGAELSAFETICSKPYVVMAGDELRLNDDAVDFVRTRGVRLVRVSQYGEKNNIDKLEAQVRHFALESELYILKGISYRFLRLLLQNASAYAGFVDSSWQPAGWTVACESLASGTSVILYEGLTSRELHQLSVLRPYVQAFDRSDREGLFNALQSAVERPAKGVEQSTLKNIANQVLDFGLPQQAIFSVLATP